MRVYSFNVANVVNWTTFIDTYGVPLEVKLAGCNSECVQVPSPDCKFTFSFRKMKS